MVDGKYDVYADGDDFIESDYLEILDKLTANNCEVSCVDFTDTNGRIVLTTLNQDFIFQKELERLLFVMKMEK